MSYHPVGTVSADLFPIEVPTPTKEYLSELWSDFTEHAGQTSALGPAAESSGPVLQKGLVSTSGKTTSSSPFPWGQYSAATLELQRRANVWLRSKGMCTVGEDGKLGAGTCGAAKAMGVAPSTCQSFTAPRVCAPASASPSLQPPVVPQEASAKPPHQQSRAVWYVAGIAAVGVAALLILKKGPKQ